MYRAPAVCLCCTRRRVNRKAWGMHPPVVWSRSHGPTKSQGMLGITGLTQQQSKLGALYYQREEGRCWWTVRKLKWKWFQSSWPFCELTPAFGGPAKLSVDTPPCRSESAWMCVSRAVWEEEEGQGQRFCSGKRLADSRGGDKTCLAARRTEEERCKMRLLRKTEGRS